MARSSPCVVTRRRVQCHVANNTGPPPPWFGPSSGNISLEPTFALQDEADIAGFKELAAKFYAKVDSGLKDDGVETGLIKYFFTVSEDGKLARCQEEYTDAAAVMAHVGNVESVLGEALEKFPMVSLQCHGPKAELAKLKDALGPVGCVFFETF